MYVGSICMCIYIYTHILFCVCMYVCRQTDRQARTDGGHERVDAHI